METDTPSNEEIAALRSLIAGAERIVALTGAGISTESGIPDFRGPNGTWGKIKPITYQEFVASEESRLEDWRRRFAMNESFARAEPNAGHLGLVRLHHDGRLGGVITQNIDGLHQRAGLPPECVIELHGNSTHGICLDCAAEISLDAVRQAIQATGASPRCACGGAVKAAIISFGQAMPEEAMRKAYAEIAAADFFFVIGSSLQVRPAATLPLLAKQAGARLVILNEQPTPLDEAADLVIRRRIGPVFEAILSQLVN